MSTNLVATVTELLTPEMLSRLSSVVGPDATTIDKSVSAGVPGVLAALVSLVAKPGGATRLAAAVAQQPPGALTNLAGAGAAGEREMIDGSMSTLSSLLGGGTMSALAGALGKYVGLSDTMAKGVLGLLSQLAMAALGQQQRANGLDASGLAQLLQSQKSNITRALPPGFARMLGDAGVFEPATSSRSTMQQAADDRSQWNWALPMLGILALGALAWYLFGRQPEQTVATLPATNVEAPMQTQRARDFIVTAEEEKSWMGRPIFSHDNQKVGEIIDIRRGPDNKVTDVYFDAGTFLGMGAKRYHLTADQIEEVKPSGLVVTLKEADIKALPEAKQ